MYIYNLFISPLSLEKQSILLLLMFPKEFWNFSHSDVAETKGEVNKNKLRNFKKYLIFIFN